ncbi:hypothetical protein ACHAPT_013602 [Fusarium lateritium]
MSSETSASNGTLHAHAENVSTSPDLGAAPTCDVDTDVLIVGAGVTGLTLTALLGDYGVKTLTIAKHSGTAPTPRAHITNQRAMEVFRDMKIEDRVISSSTPLKELGNGVIATSLTGLEVARYGCYGAAAHQLSDFTRASPCELVNLPQNVLEPLLLSRARETGADVRFSTELVHIEQSSEHVEARVRPRHTATEYAIRARYVVAADGARSSIASQLGFTFQGEPDLMAMTTTWFDADLTKYTAHRPAALYQMVRPGNAFWVGSGLLIAVTPFKEWVMNRQYDLRDGEADVSKASQADYIRATLGIPELDIRVKDVSKWSVNNVVANEYRAGRVFLAGDAAHRHPPAAGLGSNTCIQDANNLAWKLALVLSGRAGEGLLDSYHQERQPVGKQVVDHAILTLHNLTRVPQALGFHRGQSQEEGFAKLKELFADVPGAEDRRTHLAEVLKLQDRRSNALGIQLGQRYTSRAIVDDGTPFPAHVRDPILYYEPTTHPGGYLPHAWVEHEGERISSLDIPKHGEFGLIVGIGGAPWATAAETASDQVGVKLPVYFVGYRCPYDDVLGEWRERREIGDYGALLVRPDRHIAWRCAECLTNPAELLRSALDMILARA